LPVLDVVIVPEDRASHITRPCDFYSAELGRLGLGPRVVSAGKPANLRLAVGRYLARRVTTGQ